MFLPNLFSASFLNQHIDFIELAQQQQPENIEAPAAEQTVVVTDAAVEAVVAPAQASASEPESVAKDEAAAGAKRPIESADDISVSKASKDDK